MHDTLPAGHMYCRSCGYPLTPTAASRSRCPECGRRFDADDPRTWAARPPSRFAGALVLLRHALALGLLAFLGFAAWIMFGIDQWVGASWSPVFVIVCTAFGAAVLSIARLLGRSRWYTAAFIPFAAFMAVLVFADLSRIKPLLRALDEITPGMTSEEAKAIIDAHFPLDGRFPRPVIYAEDEHAIGYCVDPTHGGYNAALATIRLDGVEGLVVGTEFMPD
jgi:hypothetical protein